MSALTEHGAAVEKDLSQRYGVSPDAVRALMASVARGGGTQAQFTHPELGGMGQWSSGGMTMTGDMFNTGLQHLVSSLCNEISAAYFQGALFPPSPRPSGSRQSQAQGQGQGQTQSQGDGGPSLRISDDFHAGWWPEELGHPSSTGSQNNLSYAIFPGSHRLAVNLNGRVTVYDTGDHMIGGVGQQQSGDASWTFTSQRGTVYLDRLPVVSGGSRLDADVPPPQEPPSPGARSPEPPPPAHPAHESAPASKAASPPPPPPAGKGAELDQVFAALEKLGSLRDMGVLTEEEFAVKKAELLSRI